MRISYHQAQPFNREGVRSFYSKKPMDFHDPEERARLYAQIRRDHEPAPAWVAGCRPQFHSDVVHLVTEEDIEKAQAADSGATGILDLPPGDGLLTDLPGVALEMRTADCQSIFLYDPVRRVVGNIHSGWKGTLQQIAIKAVRRMEEAYGCLPENIEAYINPSILQCCFEVEDDVAQQFRDTVDNSDRYILKDRLVEGRQKYRIDTAAINRDRLAALGLLPEKILLSGLCTRCGHADYHSYRGDGHTAGRNGSWIWLV